MSWDEIEREKIVIFHTVSQTKWWWRRKNWAKKFVICQKKKLHKIINVWLENLGGRETNDYQTSNLVSYFQNVFAFTNEIVRFWSKKTLLQLYPNFLKSHMGLLKDNFRFCFLRAGILCAVRCSVAMWGSYLS